MFVLIKDKSGMQYGVRRNDIKRVYTGLSKTIVQFANRKENPAIFVEETVQEFFDKYLKPKGK